MENLRTIRDWAERGAQAQWCATTLAKQCGFSLTTLERWFRAQMGACPHEWMQAERMRRARDLLSRYGRIKEIAHLLNYSHSQNFSLAFKGFHGMTPREYRAMHIVCQPIFRRECETWREIIRFESCTSAMPRGVMAAKRRLRTAFYGSW